jgi:hypothetical protein
LPPLIIAHISWRRTNQSGSSELFLILLHIDAGHHILVVE